MVTETLKTISIPGTESREPCVYRLSVSQFHRMIETDILGEGDRVELIEGELRTMAAIGSRHSTSVALTIKILDPLMPDGWTTRSQQPMTLEKSEPEPDIAVVRGSIRDFADTHPKGSDAALVIEVAENSLNYDRESKLHVYAAAGIPEYWIINLVDEQVEVFRDPVPATSSAPARYAVQEIVLDTGELRVSLTGQSIGPIPVAELLP